MAISSLVVVAIALVVGLTAAPAVAQTSGATLEGRAVDKAGGVLVGVSVTATNPETGYSRNTLTGSDGRFRISGVPIGNYEVKAELEGFATVTVTGVVLNVARVNPIEIAMDASVTEAITVVSEVPLIQKSPAIGTVVSRQELEGLPINTRQFASLGSLAPGTTVGVNPDPTKVGKLVIGLNGGSGRNVNFTVDGGDNTDDTIGGQLQNFSLESVAEFNMQTQQYKAEYGRTTGGVLTVVTKSGTNDVAGSLFGFFRDDSLNAKTETQKRAGVPKALFERQQYGFSIGGPFKRDRTHYFVNGEQMKQDQEYTIQSNGIFPALDGRAFPLPTEDTLLSAKLTHEISPEQHLQIRYGYQETTTTYGAAPTVGPDSLGNLTNDFQTVLVGYDRVIGPNTFNQAVLQWSEFQNLILPNSENPTQYFPNGFIAGQNINSPQGTNQKKVQLKDDLSFSKTLGGRRHDFKVGIEYIDEGTLGGNFAPGKAGQFTRSGDSATAPITAIVVLGGDFRFSTPNDQFRVYFQDDWYVNDRLTLNLGLRYEYTDILELDQRSNPLWRLLSTQTEYNEFYLRAFQGGGGGVIDPDDDDIAPRIGFAYDLKGDGQHLLRGGWGIYYDFPYSNATVLFPGAAVLSNFAVTYLLTNPAGIRNPDGSFFQPGQPLPPGGGGFGIGINEVAHPSLSSPKASQASLGYSHQINPRVGINVEAVYVDYSDLPFRFRANPVDPAKGTRRFAAGNFRLWYGEGEAEYTGINFGVRARLSDKFNFQGFYTWSESEGNILGGADEFRLTAAEHQPDMAGARDVSVNPLDPLCGACIGPLNTDAEHRVTFAGTYEAPFGINIAGLFRYRSALPYTEHLGVDANRDAFNLDLPPGGSVNNLRGASYSQLDVRVSKEFELAGDWSIELIGEIFNVFNDDNPAAFIGNRNSASFGQPRRFAGDPGQAEQRLGQLGVRLRF